MQKQSITIINKLGLHARAAAKLVGLASTFASTIEIVRENQVVNCKSIMGILTLGAMKNNILIFRVEGDDEKEAIEAIVALINQRFGEAE